ncbi:threonine dehydratase [Ruegeria halocynthiae]|uniref:Threonine dehydratase n=1 Tax=Ruegeria halocynthiae TaxID=985054 RepID=A0A1H3EI22_9RHOB|nr:pyridoxal-phosphate dependent enzyme [Ruegeria halocynthiae]SDX78423.1 threonine dehydratase [Ruegeria halocynthiae]
MIETSEYPSLRDIMIARQRIEPVIRRTPLVFSEHLSDRAGFEVWLKLENLQIAGSFKIRGASNRILQMTDDERARGIIAVSSGNHGRAVAYLARRLGITAKIVVCDLCPENKRVAMRSYGAEVIVHGDTQDDAQTHAEDLIAQEGYTWADPYDDLHVIAGQGTIALEAFTDLPDADMIIAPLSGGGLLSGVALASKAVSPNVSVIGSSMEIEPGMVRSLQAGKPVHVEEHPSLASSITGAIGLRNRCTFPIVRDLMDHAVLISEDSLAPEMRRFADNEGMIVEGGSVTSVLAALSPEVKERQPKRAIVVISGRNIDLATFHQVTQNPEMIS